MKRWFGATAVFREKLSQRYGFGYTDTMDGIHSQLHLAEAVLHGQHVADDEFRRIGRCKFQRADVHHRQLKVTQYRGMKFHGIILALTEITREPLCNSIVRRVMD